MNIQSLSIMIIIIIEELYAQIIVELRNYLQRGESRGKSGDDRTPWWIFDEVKPVGNGGGDLELWECGDLLILYIHIYINK